MNYLSEEDINRILKRGNRMHSDKDIKETVRKLAEEVRKKYNIAIQGSTLQIHKFECGHIEEKPCDDSSPRCSLCIHMDEVIDTLHLAEQALTNEVCNGCFDGIVISQDADAKYCDGCSIGIALPRVRKLLKEME